MIVTTNYDTLLEAPGPDPRLHKEWTAVTWNDPGWAAAIRKQEVVFHLHGMAANPQSVILSSADYEGKSHDELSKIFDDFLFTSHRFLFIGCGDGLYDPHIAPLMKKAAEVRRPTNSNAGKEESEGLEHFLLVRGSELRRFNNRLPERVAPVAYGTHFGELAGFLRKLNGGIDPEVSQNPKDYDPLPSVAPAAPEPAFAAPRTEEPVTGPPAGLSTPGLPVTVLSLEVVLQQRVRKAHATLRRAARAMDQLAESLKLPDDMTILEPADEQSEHELVAASAADPAADLQDRLRQAADAVAAAAVQAAKVTLRTEPPVSAPARLATEAAGLVELLAQLAGRIALAHDDVTHRAKTSTTRYRALAAALSEARGEAEDAQRDATRMMRQFGGQREERAAGSGEAGHRAAVDPGPAAPSASPSTAPASAEAVPQPTPAAAASAPVEYVGNGVTHRSPEGLVAAGRGIESPDVLEDSPQPFPSKLLRGKALVFRVVGESMAPRIRDGDYLVVNPAGPVYDGDIAVLAKEGTGDRQENIVKKVYFGADEARYESVNPDYPGGTLTQDDLTQLIGKVIAVSRTIG